ncbi:MAG TPA: helix-turn-helix domain-containing protein [Tepidisphaeraceae bacterium]|jgi:DNA-binding CsgD family transcriptional regulator
MVADHGDDAMPRQTASLGGRTRRGNSGRKTPVAPPTAKDLGLTAAQFEVLRLLAQGLTVDQIAERLSRGRTSIYQRIQRMKDRLGLSTDGQLIAFAVERGLRQSSGAGDRS